MKKFIFFLCLILVAQFSYKVSTLPAQEEADKQAIEATIKSFYKSVSNGDFNSSMKQISPNFSAGAGESILDYEKFKNILKNDFDRRAVIYSDYSIYTIKITNLKVIGDKATVLLDFDWKAHHAKTLEEKAGYAIKEISLAKENGAWKIVAFKTWQTSEEK